MQGFDLRTMASFVLILVAFYKNFFNYAEI